MTLLPFESRYLERLRQAIVQEQTRTSEGLITTALAGGDPAIVGLACARRAHEIRGLEIALKLMQEVHDDMTGRTPRKKEAI